MQTLTDQQVQNLISEIDHIDVELGSYDHLGTGEDSSTFQDTNFMIEFGQYGIRTSIDIRTKYKTNPSTLYHPEETSAMQVSVLVFLVDVYIGDEEYFFTEEQGKLITQEIITNLNY